MPVLQDHYIRALEYAASRGKFTLEDLATSIKLTPEQKEQLALQIHKGQIFNHDASDYINNYQDVATPLHFSVEDKFRLLNYIALQEARESSESATRFAIFALTVSIISLISSACVSYMQFNSPINIPADFIYKIDGLVKGQAETNIAIYDLSRRVSAPREQKEKKKLPENN